MTIAEGNITILKDKLKDYALQILEIEKERIDTKADMADIKKELGCLMPKSYIAKTIKVWLGKGRLDEQAQDEYRDICDFLGVAYTCGLIQPNSERYANDEKTSERKRRVIDTLNRYKNLQDEHNEYSVQIRDLYARAKNSGISVPLLKKLVDFVLHPDKLSAYREDTPLLEVYTEVIPDIKDTSSSSQS